MAQRPRAPRSSVKSLSRRDALMNEIRRSIVRGDVRPGQKLTEASLSDGLNVSRSTVREAFAHLVNEGFLVQEPFRGIFVASLSAEDIQQTAQVRMAMDMLAVDQILDDATGARLAAVREAWVDYERDISQEDPLARHEAHVRFHRRLWEASGNAALVRLWPAIEAQVALQLAEDQRLASDLNRDVDVHRRLVEALERAFDGDRSDLGPAFEAHTFGSLEALIASLPVDE